jgi:uncharacterized membrane protein YfcA
MSTANFGDLLIVILLALAGFVAGFINTLAGGGSLLTLPILVLTGLSWESANATSRISVLLQTASAVHGFARYERLEVRDTLALGAPTLLGAAIGALLTYVTDARAFEFIAVLLLVGVGLAMLIYPKLTRGATPKTLAERPIAAPLLFLVGVYAGFLQAGVGYLLLAVFGGVLGRDLASGNALKSALVLGSTVVALPILGGDTDIAWVHGLILGLGSVLGAQLAVRFAIRASPATLRFILLGTLAVVVAVSLAR